MINTPTVLILGAGASAGFPTGWDLLTQARSQDPRGLAEMIKPVDASAAPALHLAITNTGDKSLDAMLEHRQELVQAGKALMARALLFREEAVRNTTRDQRGAWYRELWAALDVRSFEDFRHNQLTIVTYNYDRSLEYFLIAALRAKFLKPPVECGEALAGIGPIHLHGQLGFLPELAPRSPSPVPYGCAGEGVTNANVDIAAQGIKIIHQARPTDDGFVRAKVALASAKKVVFLGFGFAPTNVERLALNTCLDPNVPIYACTMGYTTQQVDFRIMPLFREWGTRMFGEENMDIVNFLRRYPEALA